MIRFRTFLFVMLAVAAADTVVANPLSFLGETYSEWKERLFGSEQAKKTVTDAPPRGPISLAPGQPLRVRVDGSAERREFPRGESRYRSVELPRRLEHAALRVQVVAQPNPHGSGKTVFKPVLYTLAGDRVETTVEVKPLHIDIRPFQRTRLLACVALDDVERFALATPAEAIGKSYESEVREAVKAPSIGGFYYRTDAIKTRLPYSDGGEIILEIDEQPESGKGC